MDENLPHADIPELKVLGWKEKVDLPEFELFKMPAKIDTGAKTSVLHCSHIALKKVGNKKYVEFSPLDPKDDQGQEQIFRLPFHSERKIKNSFGQEENRYIIKTKIKLHGQFYPIEVSLRDRSGMEFPMLLGRSFIRGKFVIDVSKSNLASKTTSKTASKKHTR